MPAITFNKKKIISWEAVNPELVKNLTFVINQAKKIR